MIRATILHQPRKFYYSAAGDSGGKNTANPIAEDDIIGDAEQIQLSQWSSKPEARSSTGKHICQLDLRGIAAYRSLSIWLGKGAKKTH